MEFREDFTAYDRNNVNGVMMSWGYYQRENLTGAAFHGDMKRVETILNLKVGKQDIEQTEGGIGTHVRSMTPLGIAASRGHIGIVRLLLYHQANPNGTGAVDDYYTATPLFAAVQSRNIDIAKLLIENGADVDSSASVHPKTEGGATAMYYAAEHNLFEMAKLLHRSDACLMVPSGAGLTPYDIARANKHVEMQRWLLDMMDLDRRHKHTEGGLRKEEYFVPDWSGGRVYR
jgi:ankyrin repeat protein